MAIEYLYQNNVLIQYDASLSDDHKVISFIFQNLDLRVYFEKKISTNPQFQIALSNPKSQIVEFFRFFFQNDIDQICNAIVGHSIEDRLANNIFERCFGLNIPIPYFGNISYIPISWVILECIWNYENRNRILFTNRNRNGFHKGTAYGWMFEYYMIQDSIDTAFNYMVQAMEEDHLLPDYRTHPAYFTVSLIEPQDLTKPFHAYPYIKVYIDELKNILLEYNQEVKTTFQYSNLIAKFLGNINFEKEKILFVHSFMNAYHFIQCFKEELSNNQYTATLALDHLFNLTLLFENMILEKYPNDKLFFSLRDFCKDPKFNWDAQVKLESVNSKYKNWDGLNESDFDKLLQKLIIFDFELPISDRPSIRGSYLSIVGLIRNLTAHNIIHWKSISKKMSSLLKIIIKAFLVLIENKY